MNFIIYFFVVIVCYLGLARSTEEQYFAINSITTIEELKNNIGKAPATLVLLGVKSHGTFLNSYYMRVKQVSAFYPAIEFYLRVPKPLATEYSRHIGLSIFSVTQTDRLSYSPEISIPGMSFVGNPQLGRWITVDHATKWSFYRAYRHLPVELGWENFSPTINEHLAYSKYANTKYVYLGADEQFGAKGPLTKKFLLRHRNNSSDYSAGISKSFFKSYFEFSL